MDTAAEGAPCHRDVQCAETQAGPQTKCPTG
jgi:hypothetical protein